MDYNKEVELDADALAMFMDKVKDPKEKKAFQEAAKNAKIVKGLTYEKPKKKKNTHPKKMKGVKPSPYLKKLQAKNKNKKAIPKKVVTKKARKPKMLVFEAHYMTARSKKTFTFQATDGFEISDLKDAIAQALKTLPAKDMLLTLYDIPLVDGTLRQCGIEDDAVLFVSDVRQGFDNHFERVGGFLKKSGMSNNLDADVNDALYGFLGVNSEQEARNLPLPKNAKVKKEKKGLAVGGDYSEMTSQALRNLCEVRGIKVSTWDKRKLVELLAAADEQQAADGTLERPTNREMPIENKEEEPEPVKRKKSKKKPKKKDEEKEPDVVVSKPKKSKKKPKKPAPLENVASGFRASIQSVVSVEPPKTPASLPPPPPAHASLLREPTPEPPEMSDDESFPTTRPPNGSVIFEDQKEDCGPPAPPPAAITASKKKKKKKKAAPKPTTVTLDVQIGMGATAKHKQMVLNVGVTAKALKRKIALEEDLDESKLELSRANIPLKDSATFEQGDEVMCMLPIEKKKKKKAAPAKAKAPPKALPKPALTEGVSSAASRAAMWDKKIGGDADDDKAAYLKKGTKSHERMLKARAWAKRKLQQLFDNFPKIPNCTTNKDGTLTCKFIDVFEFYQDIDTVIVGILESAKKKGLAEYDNKRNFPLLQQRYDDDVLITLYPARFEARKAKAGKS